MLLVCSLSFVALPVIVQSPGKEATPSQIVGQASIVATFGSIITGLVLVKRHSTLKGDDMREVVCRAVIPSCW